MTKPCGKFIQVKSQSQIWEVTGNMVSLSVKAYLIMGIRVFLGLVFLISSIAKFFEIREFSRVVQEFGYLPPALADIIAIVLPSIEFLVGFFLVIGLWTGLATGFAMGLMMIFVAVIIPHPIIGNEIECGCFGLLTQSKVDLTLILRNIVLLSLTVLVLRGYDRRNKEKPLETDS